MRWRSAGRSAALGVTLLLGACRLAGPRAEAPARVPADLPAAEPSVRVGLAVDTTAVTVGSRGGAYRLAVDDDVVADAGAGARWTVTADGDGRLIAERADDGDGDGGIGPFTSPLRVVPDEGGTVEVAGRPYRGTALVRAVGPGRVTVVNVVALETYLLGVVPAEIPAVDLDAVKAQAVAARTYAMRNLGRWDSLGFDVFGTVMDQAYGGVTDEHPVATRAVRETRGEVVLYGGAPIMAYYHSTCGGRTAAADEVWSRERVPYLRSVSDRIPGTDAYYCETSNRFRWTERWTGDGLATALERGLAEYLGRDPDPIAAVRGLEVTERTTSDRVRTLRIRADGETHRVHGDSIRWVLRPERDRILNSTLFELEVEEADGRVAGAVARGGGWGHGVGMCQWGAIGRAERGEGYRRILSHYYPGTEIRRLY